MALLPTSSSAQAPDTLLYPIPPPAGVQSGAQTGAAVATDGVRTVVGSPQDDTLANNAGVARIYDAVSGVLLYELPNPAPAANDSFGGAVAISGARVVVAAPNDDLGSSNAGTAYVFDLAGANPTVPTVVLGAPSPQGGANFGYAVAISGNLVVAGAYDYNTSVDGAGRAWVFDLGSATPATPVHTLDSPSQATSEEFGVSVAISGTKIVIAARRDDTSATDAGIAYVFDVGSGTPTTPLHTLLNPTPQGADLFGTSVGISGSYVAVGADRDNTAFVDAGAVYVYHLAGATPATPIATVNNPTPAASDFFGISLALSGSRLVVAAHRDDTGATDAGSAYVYDLTPTSATLSHSLFNPSPGVDDLFGFSVAIAGTTVVVGANQDDDIARDSGAAYSYNLASGTPTSPVITWNEAGPSGGDEFGNSVAISGNRLVIGAPSNDTDVPNGGIVYVYDLAGSTPDTPVLTLHNPDPAADDNFGYTVAISGSRLAVSAYQDDTAGAGAGAVYVYDLDGATPDVPVYSLYEPVPSAQFGLSLDISGTRLVVGAIFSDVGATDAGSAYVYDLTGATPATPVFTLNNPAPSASDNFGRAVGISGSRVVVGAYFDDATGSNSGIAYVYDLSSGTPTTPTTLNNPSPASNDWFGRSLSVSGSLVVIGAWNDDTGAANTGSAYVYDFSSGTPTTPAFTLNNPDLGVGANFSGTVDISGSRVLVAAFLDDFAALNSGSVYLYDLAGGTPLSPVTIFRNPSPDEDDEFGQSVALDGPFSVVGAHHDDIVSANKGYAYVYGQPPTVTTPTSASISTTSAILGGNVISDGGGAITERGVVYSIQLLNGSPQLGGANVTKVTASGTTGVFTANSGVLEVGVTYAFAAYATNAAGTGYTSTGTFTTLGVGNTDNGGPGSLRQALLAAAANPGPDNIVFNTNLSGQTITLASELQVTDNDDVTLDGGNVIPGIKITGSTRLISQASNGMLTLRGLTLTGGNSNSNGGAISSVGTLVLENCTLVGNFAETGGAVFSNGSLTLTNCTFTENSATSGGAVYHLGTLEVKHCTITANLAQNGGGIYVASGTWTLANSIVAGNIFSTSGNGRDIANSGKLTRLGGNIVQDLFNSIGAGTDGGPDAINAPPFVSPLADNYGPTETMAPHPTSAAIDQASVLSTPLTTDQRGFPRPLGLRPDIGAMEGAVIMVTTAVDELDPPGTPGSGVSLREALRDAPPSGAVIAFDRAVFSGLTPTTNTLTLTKGPLPASSSLLYGLPNPGGITLVNAPVIIAQPQSLSQAAGTTAVFTVAAPDVNNAYTHQWRKNGVSIPLAIGSTLTLNNITEDDEAVYDVRLFRANLVGPLMVDVRYANAAEIVSQPASLIVDTAPLGIQRGPANAMIALGSSHTLSVVASGPGTLTYQWLLQGKNISGATSRTYTIAKAALTHAGAYQCLVKTGTQLPGVFSAAAEIGVVDTAVKTFHLKAGATFTALVNAAGNGPLSYAWLKNGGSTTFNTKTFTIKPVAAGDAGLYTCTVTGAAGVFTGGAPTRLTVSNAAPQIMKPLTPPPAVIGQNYFYQIPIASVAGAPATAFTVGGLPPGMTWDKLTGIISGRPTASTKPLGYPLTIKASNPFSSDSTTTTLLVNVVPATAVGTFAGPLERSTLNDNLGGRFDLVTTASGACSGSVTLGARAKIPFTNQLLLSSGVGDVILRANIPGITLPDKTVLTAYIEVFALDQRAVLTLVHPTLGTTLLTAAWRNSWTKTKPATAYAATYTARLDPENVGTSPRGYGFATLSVAADGSVKLSGKLPDGSGITDGGFVGPEGQLMLFNLLYTKRGSLVGPLQITPAPLLPDNTLDGTLSWFKPAPLPKSTDTVYKDGFGPLNVAVAGSPYIAPAKGQRVMGLGTAPNPNAKMAFTLGGLSPEFEQFMHISNPSAIGLTNKATIVSPVFNGTKVTLLDAAKGLIGGNFTIAGASTALDRPAPFEGLIVKIGATTRGYGYFLLPSVPVGLEKVATSPKLSGRVVLGAP
ncbi:choice-of-anchor Q domain-containing protein [Brevifollis gellanilyticus]|uniref:Ig-like domain-containing protein n=1 Tax=Brevifollis gellanilyticus TaxID=748831 RepID=A0A512M3B6_9BACT|nr:choice-of-anchor Q domain-containing protein [Brevifollis gellanilyticus]GEP41222.1 hypothetical protein BGE01nite_05130 [Brevifollis gellanilyticus]